MKVRSVKANFIFSNVRLVMNLLIPAVVFPYVSRVLGPDGIGRVEFVNSVVSYFSNVCDEVVGAAERDMNPKSWT